jgi:2-C-methyl-D-erythritol 4-phosphate cytidylyltransferase|tara:strand:- start:840 stop:1022 length:183 start_codon:yes stop_codon:yes gene_type:complete
MFRTRDLLKAMLDLGQEMSTITDEASAMERAGLGPLLVHSHQDNIKITTPEDLRLAELLL